MHHLPAPATPSLNSHPEPETPPDDSTLLSNWQAPSGTVAQAVPIRHLAGLPFQPCLQNCRAELHEAGSRAIRSQAASGHRTACEDSSVEPGLDLSSDCSCLSFGFRVNLDFEGRS